MGKMTESILLLAPSSANAPKVLDEAERVLSSTRARVVPLVGETAFDDLLDAVTGGTFSIFWYCGHLSSDGIELKGDRLTVSRLASLLRGRFSLIVLNTCQSNELARRLFAESQVTVVGTVSEVEDLEAFQVGILFLRTFLQTHNAERAYHQVRTSSYILFPAESKANTSMDELTKALQELREELYNAKTEIAVLGERVSAWEKRMDSMLDTLSTTHLSPFLVLLITGPLFIICILLAIIAFRGIL